MSNHRSRPKGLTCIESNNPTWSPAEEAVLRKHYPTGTRATVLAALPGRTWNAVSVRASSLHIKRYGYWTPARLKTLADNYPTKGGPYVARLLGCPLSRVAKQVSLRGIARLHAPKPTPTPKAVKSVSPMPTPKPKPVAQPVAQHQPARLNNLINQKAKKKKAATPERAVSVAYIKSLPYHHPEAHQYRMGGESAVLQYRNQLQQQAA